MIRSRVACGRQGSSLPLPSASHTDCVSSEPQPGKHRRCLALSFGQATSSSVFTNACITSWCCNFQPCWKANASITLIYNMVGVGAKVSKQSTPSCCPNPRTTNLAFALVINTLLSVFHAKKTLRRNNVHSLENIIIRKIPLLHDLQAHS